MIGENDLSLSLNTSSLQFERSPLMYQIRPGDTLSALARRYGTSVSAFMKANPYIQNANLIYSGRSLNIPGKSDSFEPGRPNNGGGNSNPGQVQGPSNTGPATSGPSGSPFALAQSVLGQNASSLKVSGGAIGRAMEDWVPNNVNCANFVSAALQASGQINYHDNSVMGLMAKLDRDPKFQRVSLANAKPGDVVSMKTNGGQHVVMFAGWKNGKPQFIGSNNVNSDGSQKITFSSMNYPIMAIHQYRG